MTKLLKPVQRLLIGIMILLVAVAVSSLAEEIIFPTIRPKNIGSLITYVSWKQNTNETIDESTDVLTDYLSFTFNAPKSGTILITWNYTGPYVLTPSRFDDTITSTSGSLGFAIKLYDIENEEYVEGSFGTLQYIENIARFAKTEDFRYEGDVLYSPIVEQFSVTGGKAYTIKYQYIAKDFDNCWIHLNGNSTGGQMVEIEYFDT